MSWLVQGTSRGWGMGLKCYSSNHLGKLYQQSNSRCQFLSLAPVTPVLSCVALLALAKGCNKRSTATKVLKCRRDLRLKGVTRLDWQSWVSPCAVVLHFITRCLFLCSALSMAGCQLCRVLAGAKGMGMGQASERMTVDRRTEMSFLTVCCWLVFTHYQQ